MQPLLFGSARYGQEAPISHGQEGLVTSFPPRRHTVHNVPTTVALQRSLSSSSASRLGLGNQVVRRASAGPLSPRLPAPVGYPEAGQNCVFSPRPALLPSPRQESLTRQMSSDMAIPTQFAVTIDSPRVPVDATICTQAKENARFVEVPCQSVTQAVSSTLTPSPRTPPVPNHLGRRSSEPISVATWNQLQGRRSSEPISGVIADGTGLEKACRISGKSRSARGRSLSDARIRIVQAPATENAPSESSEADKRVAPVPATEDSTRIGLQDLARLVEDLSRRGNVPISVEHPSVEVQILSSNDEPTEPAKTGDKITLKMAGVTKEQLEKALQQLSAAREGDGFSEAEARLEQVQNVLRRSSSISATSLGSFQLRTLSNRSHQASARSIVSRFADATSSWILRSVFASWATSSRSRYYSQRYSLASAFNDSAQTGNNGPSSILSSHQFTPTFSNSPGMSEEELFSAEAWRRERSRWMSWVDKSFARLQEEACCRCFSAWRQKAEKAVTSRKEVQLELKSMQDAARILETTKTLQEEAMVRIGQKFSMLHEKVSLWTASAAQKFALVLTLTSCHMAWYHYANQCKRGREQVEFRTRHRERTSRTIARRSEVSLTELCLRSWHHEVLHERSLRAHEQQLEQQLVHGSSRVTQLEETLAEFELAKAEALASRSAALSAELSGALVEQCDKAAREATRQCRWSNAVAVEAYCSRKAAELERRSLSVVLSVWLIEVCSSVAVKMQQASSASMEAGLKHQLQETSHQLEKARTSDWELRARFDQRRCDVAKRCGLLRIAANIHRYFAAWRHVADSKATLQVKALSRAQDTWRNEFLAISSFSAWRQYARCTGLLLRRWRALSLALLRVVFDMWKFIVLERTHSSSGPSTPTRTSSRKAASRFLPVTDSVSTAASQGSLRSRDSPRKEDRQMVPRQTSKTSLNAKGSSREASLPRRIEGRLTIPKQTSKTSSATSLSEIRGSSREASRSSRKSEPSLSGPMSNSNLPHTFVHLKDLCLAKINLDDESFAREGFAMPQRPNSQGFVSTPRRGHQWPSGHGVTRG